MNRQDAKVAKKTRFEPPRRQDAKKIFIKLSLIYSSVRRMPESRVFMALASWIRRSDGISIIQGFSEKKSLAILASWRFKKLGVLAVQHVECVGGSS